MSFECLVASSHDVICYSILALKIPYGQRAWKAKVHGSQRIDMTSTCRASGPQFYLEFFDY